MDRDILHLQRTAEGTWWSQTHQVIIDHYHNAKWQHLTWLASLVYKVLNTGPLPYLIDLLQYHKSAWSTRSSASHFLFRDTTFHLALALFASLCQNMELCTSSHLPILNVLFFQTSSQDTLLSLSLSCPLTAPIMRNDSLLRLWRYINPLHAYLHSRRQTVGQAARQSTRQ